MSVCLLSIATIGSINVNAVTNNPPIVDGDGQLYYDTDIYTISDVTYVNGYAELWNKSDSTRWGSVSIIAYDPNNAATGSTGNDESIRSGSWVSASDHFDRTTYKIRYSGCLYYSNNPYGTPISTPLVIVMV